MMLIKFGHGRWDVSFDRNTRTDNQIAWTNISDEPQKVEVETSYGKSQFTMAPGATHKGWTGSILRIIEIEVNDE
jgi:hypothetical protein